MHVFTHSTAGRACVEAALRQADPAQLQRELDEVAYLRFASVYQAFDSLEDFEASIAQLRADHAARAEA